MAKRKHRRGKNTPAKKEAGYFERMAAVADIPPTAVSGGMRAELFQNTQMMIENHKGILEYENEMIRVNCGALTMRIEGEALVIVAMTDKDISVRGRIISINFVNT